MDQIVFCGYRYGYHSHNGCPSLPHSRLSAHTCLKIPVELSILCVLYERFAAKIFTKISFSSARLWERTEASNNRSICWPFSKTLFMLSSRFPNRKNEFCIAFTSLGSLSSPSPLPLTPIASLFPTFSANVCNKTEEKKFFRFTANILLFTVHNNECFVI